MPPIDPDVRIGMAIREARERHHLRQEDLGRLLHMNQSVVSRVEKGERGLSFAEAIDIANILHLDLHELLGEHAKALLRYLDRTNGHTLRPGRRAVVA